MQTYTLATREGYSILLTQFETVAPKGVVLVNAAMGISQRYYASFALYLASQGFTTITYDYRGIAKSAPAVLRQDFKAGFKEMADDLEILIDYIKLRYSDLPLGVVGHSIGGVFPILIPNIGQVDAFFTVGAQMAHTPDFGPTWWKRQKISFLWFQIMPFLTNCFGYFPGQKLKLGFENMPAQFIKELLLRSRFENIFDFLAEHNINEYHTSLHAPTLALTATDDPICTKKAIYRLFDQLKHTPVEYQFIEPKTIGAKQIGHNRFFSKQFATTLWPIATDWFEKYLAPLPPKGEFGHSDIITRTISTL